MVADESDIVDEGAGDRFALRCLCVRKIGFDMLIGQKAGGSLGGGLVLSCNLMDCLARLGVLRLSAYTKSLKMAEARALWL